MEQPGKTSRVSVPGGWRPRGTGQWALTVVACPLAVVTGVVAAYMLHPIDYDSWPGQLAFVAFVFPLHLLVVTVATAALGVLAWRCRAGLPASAFGLAAVLTACMASWPSIAMWQRAREENVPLSLGIYLANALHPNIGGPQPERSVVFGTAPDGTVLVLDVWRADRVTTGALRPAVVRVHGGVWIRGQRSELGAWNPWLNRLGYDVFDVEYRKPPPARWQDEVGDVKCALGWVAAQAARNQIDPARISVMGYSAGGNLAMLAAYSMGDRQLPPSCDVAAVPVRSVVNLYGPADLILLYGSSGSLGYIQAALEQYIGGPPTQYPDRYRAVSPLGYVSAETPPTITVLGECDRIISIDQARSLDRAFTRAGASHETHLLPANDHAFDANWGGFGTQFARDKIKRFLQQHG